MMEGRKDRNTKVEQGGNSIWHSRWVIRAQGIVWGLNKSGSTLRMVLGTLSQNLRSSGDNGGLGRRKQRLKAQSVVDSSGPRE